MLLYVRPLLVWTAIFVALPVGAVAARAGGAEDKAEPPCDAQSPAAPAEKSPGAAAEELAGHRLTPEKLDALLEAVVPGPWPATTTERQFLRRMSFDLVGRLPTLSEQRQFAAEPSPRQQAAVVDRLLASEEFGANWANYWADTIAFRVPPPELTYLDYGPLKKWLADKFNSGANWDDVTRALITAKGKIQDQPAATLIGYHQADATNLASEVSRVFLGQQIACAQCHDHPFASWKREQFHSLAAFFARTKAKLPHNDGPGTVVSAADKGEYQMPDAVDPANKPKQLRPAFLDGAAAKEAGTDAQRRARLADWITSPDNTYFAAAYTNRVWARLMGRGFCESVDDLSDAQSRQWGPVHDALARHFAATGYDVKELFRLICSTRGYRQGLRTGEVGAGQDDSGAQPPRQPSRFRGDEVFAALTTGLDLPNVTPQAIKPTAAIRFPPPPKTTRDLVFDAFGSDPSLPPGDAPRTIAQALWMMNHEQLQRQISAAPDSGTMLARLLIEQSDDKEACQQLYARVLARPATAEETRIVLDHVHTLGNRGTAFEDVLWGLVNSTEFTTRR